MNKSYEIKYIDTITARIEFHLKSNKTILLGIKNPKYNHKKGIFITELNNQNIEELNFMFVYFSPDKNYYFVDYFHSSNHVLESFLIEQNLTANDLLEISNQIYSITQELESN